MRVYGKKEQKFWNSKASTSEILHSSEPSMSSMLGHWFQIRDEILLNQGDPSWADSRRFIIEQHQIYYRMSSIIGTLSVDSIFLIYLPAMILTPAYTYYLAVMKGEEKPFPQATVTSVACHYPQDIIFRYVMLIGSSILALAFFLEFRWASWQASRTRLQPLPQGYLWATYLSIACYAVTIATIDEEGVGELHVPCAIAFVIIFFIAIVRLTFYYAELRTLNSSTISSSSLALKKALSFYNAGVWVYCLYMLITASTENHSDVYVAIVEWNSLVTNLLWLLSSIIDWRRIQVALIKH